MHYAIIEKGVVTNVAMADAPLAPNWVATETAGIGWTYKDEVFIAPEIVVPAPPAPTRELTKREWRLLFTDQERPPIDRFNAQFETNNLLTEEQRDDIRSGLEDYKAATVVSKDDPATVRMLGLYVALGLLAAHRPAEILA